MLDTHVHTRTPPMSDGRSRPRPARTLLAVGALALALGTVACSDDGGDDGGPNRPAPTAVAPDVDGADDELDGGGDDPSIGLAPSGGSASVTVGDATWEFDAVQCAFGEDEIGIEGAIWNMAARDGSLSLYAAIDPDATYIELADLDDDEAANLMSTGDVVIQLDGKRATSSATFVDVNGEHGLEFDGALEVVCP